jgi:hypothetical protein
MGLGKKSKTALCYESKAAALAFLRLLSYGCYPYKMERRQIKVYVFMVEACASHCFQ